MSKLYLFVIVTGLITGVFFGVHWSYPGEEKSTTEIKALTVDQSQLAGAQILDITFGEVPEFSLLTKDDRKLSQEDLKNAWTFFVFGFTHCPDICPGTLAVMSQVLARNFSEQPNVVFVSVDPERDNIQDLNRYTSHFHDEIIPLTGESESVRKLYEALGIKAIVRRNDGSAMEYTVDHTTLIYLADQNLRLRARFVPPFFPDAIYSDYSFIVSQLN